MLRGQVALFVFDDTGKVVETHVLGKDGLLGVDVPAGAWHCIACLSDTAVCYEVKPGPWDPASDKQHATWAPAEGDAAAEAYLNSLVESLQSDPT